MKKQPQQSTQTPQSPQSIYDLLHKHFGERHWWPADTPFEVIVGAILTQNTAWRNVEYAIDNLKEADALSCRSIADLHIEQLELLIRPAGFFRQKAERLQLICHYMIDHYQNDLNNLFQKPMTEVRAELLQLKGVGPETADSILLYAGGMPSFVVDAYTKRIFSRLGLLTEKDSYDRVRDWFMAALPTEVQLFNEYHALIVETAKEHCSKRKPKCETCPLGAVCPADGVECKIVI